MALRITTWNVNGIRNPFSYKPWSDKKSFEAMFDILEADIVCMQETKIQRKDLRDDMVLIPGWDCFFTFPKYKKGYSGVAVYTRQSKCSPIKVEEGITGILEPPGQPGKTYLSLPPSESIGGYPVLSEENALLLDSEGRCIVLDFGGFILIGVYCPAARDSQRDEFRIAFVDALCQRVRALVQSLKRRVVVIGDLNIARDVIDSAAAREMLRSGELETYTMSPTTRLLDKLLVPHDEGVMVDLCRNFYPDRLGMYTCWDTRLNTRPGNYGSRIDYILCSSSMESWFVEANIQEGLMGSDHCPVYGIINETVDLEGQSSHVLDLVNPNGHFQNGERQPSTSPIAQPKLSGRLLPEFKSRRSIRDMFAKAGSSNSASQTPQKFQTKEVNKTNEPEASGSLPLPLDCPDETHPGSQSSASTSSKTPDMVSATQQKVPKISQDSKISSSSMQPSKRQKINSSHKYVQPQNDQTTRLPGRQQSLKSFFRPREPAGQLKQRSQNVESSGETEPVIEEAVPGNHTKLESESVAIEPLNKSSADYLAEDVKDPIVAKELWTKLFNKPAPPKCDVHNEHCIQLVTKKQGINCGRAFWICPR
ncbi:Class II abasic (AP) endonuclease [Rhizina undulata]